MCMCECVSFREKKMSCDFTGISLTIFITAIVPLFINMKIGEEEECKRYSTFLAKIINESHWIPWKWCIYDAEYSEDENADGNFKVTERKFMKSIPEAYIINISLSGSIRQIIDFWLTWKLNANPPKKYLLNYFPLVLSFGLLERTPKLFNICLSQQDWKRLVCFEAM